MIPPDNRKDVEMDVRPSEVQLLGSAKNEVVSLKESRSFGTLSNQNIRPVPRLREYSASETTDNSAPFHFTPKIQKKRASFLQLIHFYIPITYWLPNYDTKKFLVHDFLAGLTIGSMLVPQSMAYALIASLEPIYGLYTGAFASLIYPFFGTSGQVHVGPVAITSLMTSAIVLDHVREDEQTNPDKYNAQLVAIASLAAFQVGIIQTLFGLLHAGVLAHMLSHPVVVGFTSSAALIIGTTQVKNVLKIDVKSGHEWVTTVYDVFKELPHASLKTFGLSVVTMIFLFAMKYWKKNKKLKWSDKAKFIPAPLIAVIIGTSISYGIGDSTGWERVGSIDRGLPSPSNMFSKTTTDTFVKIIPESVLMALVGFIEAYAVASRIADKRGYKLDPSQELLAFGCTNIFTCFFQGYNAAGSLSRTVVADAGGAVTPTFSFICGIFMIIALLTFISVLSWLPKAILGSIVMTSVVNLIDVKEMKKLWKLKKRDFVSMLITFLFTLSFGVEIGLAIGVLSSLLLYIQEASKPNYSILGRMPKTKMYRNAMYNKEAEKHIDILIFRWHANLFFGNIESFKNRIRKHLKRFIENFPEDNVPNEYLLLLCFSGINDIDASASEEFYTYIEDLHKNDPSLQFAFCNLHSQVVHDTLNHVKIEDIIGKEWIFEGSVRSAVQQWYRRKTQNRQYKKLIDEIQSSDDIPNIDHQNSLISEGNNSPIKSDENINLEHSPSLSLTPDHEKHEKFLSPHITDITDKDNNITIIKYDN